ncbi:hypothetical protein [Streptomyces sp. NBC_01565]|uniref:hypothetical protein n=1 Tax=Streptomyces sp. NBC_01565 TaxID=2975881 RepID=UPI002258E29A|nr:hypothetical protein [Streptomyces sp. NBC_01565]MCX4546438.1 hypothetical protein [Streptomyces sp. NBC_01565]
MPPHLVTTGGAGRIDACFGAAGISPDHEFDAATVAVARRGFEDLFSRLDRAHWPTNLTLHVNWHTGTRTAPTLRHIRLPDVWGWGRWR